MNSFPRGIAPVLLLFFGLAYALLIPPFQAPDEPAHFARAYGLAEGQFILRDHPRELVAMILQHLGAQYDISGIPMLQDIGELLDGSGERVPNIAYNTSQYSFIPYLFHAGIIKAVMAAVDHPKDLPVALYACRIGSVLVLTTVVWASMAMAPTIAWIIFWLAATPMALSQASMVSTDVLVLSSGLVLLCVGLSRLTGIPYALSAGSASFVLLTAKPPYVFILLAPLAGAVLASGGRRFAKAAVLCLSGGLAVIAGYIWKSIVISEGIYGRTLETMHRHRSMDIDPVGQWNFLLDAPAHFGLVLWNTLTQQGGELFQQFVGVLGWQDLPVPTALVAVWGILILVSLGLSYRPSDMPPMTARLLGGAYLVSGLMTAFAVLMALYLVWMPVGANCVDAQGRYFHLPALAALVGIVLILPASAPVRFRWIMGCLLVAACTAVNTGALAAVIRRYGIWNW